MKDNIYLAFIGGFLIICSVWNGFKGFNANNIEGHIFSIFITLIAVVFFNPVSIIGICLIIIGNRKTPNKDNGNKKAEVFEDKQQGYLSKEIMNSKGRRILEYFGPTWLLALAIGAVSRSRFPNNSNLLPQGVIISLSVVAIMLYIVAIILAYKSLCIQKDSKVMKGNIILWIISFILPFVCVIVPIIIWNRNNKLLRNQDLWIIKRFKMELDTLTFQRKSKIMNGLGITVLIFFVTVILGGIIYTVISLSAK